MSLITHILRLRMRIGSVDASSSVSGTWTWARQYDFASSYQNLRPWSCALLLF